LFETVHFECHQQRSVTSKCTKIGGGWSFAPDPTGGAYSAPVPLAGLKGHASKGRGERRAGEGGGIGGKERGMERGRKRTRGGREQEGREGREFGPSQCWKQIDAAGHTRRCGRRKGCCCI